jgi:NTP pyrophosphatase (non-canonical NTP hydrolase)
VAELGDSLFSLLCMANEMGVDVEDVLRATLARYRERRPGQHALPDLEDDRRAAGTSRP